MTHDADSTLCDFSRPIARFNPDRPIARFNLDRPIARFNPDRPISLFTPRRHHVGDELKLGLIISLLCVLIHAIHL